MSRESVAKKLDECIFWYTKSSLEEPLSSVTAARSPAAVAVPSSGLVCLVCGKVQAARAHSYGIICLLLQLSRTQMNINVDLKQESIT